MKRKALALESLKDGKQEKCKLLFSNYLCNDTKLPRNLYAVILKNEIYILTFCDNVAFFSLDCTSKRFYFKRRICKFAAFIAVSDRRERLEYRCFLLSKGCERKTRRARCAVRFILKNLD